MDEWNVTFQGRFGQGSRNDSVQESLRITRILVTFALMACTWIAPVAEAASRKPSRLRPPVQPAGAPSQTTRQAEAKLVEIYRLVGRSKLRDALLQAEQLVQAFPNFQLAHLVHGDILVAMSRPLQAFGDVSTEAVSVAKSSLDDLRSESLQRLRALQQRPPLGSIPSQFLSLSPSTRHAIAIDASRSRLYLFENRATGLELMGDYYISLGKSGTAKALEGDQRTPLGVYYITSNLDRRTLKDFYGAGALPINYPNVLDHRRGKTGSGIWLHGTPPGQFSRAPLATDGCVVLSNPDLEHIVRTVAVRTTPVVIASELQWVAPQSTKAERGPFEEALQGWKSAKSSGNLQHLLSFYATDFQSNGKNLTQWAPVLLSELSRTQGHSIALKDLSYLRWKDNVDTMVVTFGEVAEGTRTGWNKRQYWIRQDNTWKIFYEGVI